jgi:hypothetical protein
MNAISQTFLVAAEVLGAQSSWVAPTIVVALLALGVSLGTFFLAGRRARVDRQRQIFAEAFEVVMEYREYPFIVRRRDGNEPAKERQRISADLSKVQARMNAFKARLLVEDPHIGRKYTELVAKTREVAGAMIRDAWNQRAVAADDEIHAPVTYDFRAIGPADSAYLRAVADHLRWLPAGAARKLRERRQNRDLPPSGG